MAKKAVYEVVKIISEGQGRRSPRSSAQITYKYYTGKKKKDFEIRTKHVQRVKGDSHRFVDKDGNLYA